ncbi:MAG: tetratricopeptide repeat protein [Chloroflexi bacterium]|nr:tetratricopeptide repeat protein [Chloroflexota bacterium]
MSVLSPASESQYWQANYPNLLAQRLERSSQYLHSAPLADVRAHLASFLTLLKETHRYPALTQRALELISTLHPLPLRWGMGYLWELHLRFALDNTPAGHTEQRCEYQCALADVEFFSGNFEPAITLCQEVLATPAAPPRLSAHASRILYNCLRSIGQPNQADELVERMQPAFLGERPAAQVPQPLARAWLLFNQCQLERLRERGKMDQALNLLEEMIWLDQQEGSPEKALTADLVTHRSTLLWAKARYPASVADLKQAMQLYREAEDHFNAESLNSNLGLVYWSMGELPLAEETLQAAIDYYKRTGSQQLITYDIGNLGLVHFARGSLDEALRLTRQHIEHAQKINFIAESHRGRRNLGTILYYFGEYQQAIEELTSSNVYYENHGSRDGYGLDFLWLALCHHALRDHNKALDMAKGMIAWCQQMDTQLLLQLTLRCLAFLSPPSEKEALLRQSLELVNHTERKLEKAAVLLALANASGDEADWQQGCQILREIGAERWLHGRGMDNPPFIPMFV